MPVRQRSGVSIPASRRLHQDGARDAETDRWIGFDRCWQPIARPIVSRYRPRQFCYSVLSAGAH